MHLDVLVAVDSNLHSLLPSCVLDCLDVNDTPGVPEEISKEGGLSQVFFLREGSGPTFRSGSAYDAHLISFVAKCKD